MGKKFRILQKMSHQLVSQTIPVRNRVTCNVLSKHAKPLKDSISCFSVEAMQSHFVVCHPIVELSSLGFAHLLRKYRLPYVFVGPYLLESLEVPPHTAHLCLNRTQELDVKM